MFCTKCGKEISAFVAFCQHCGQGTAVGSIPMTEQAEPKQAKTQAIATMKNGLEQWGETIDNYSSRIFQYDIDGIIDEILNDKVDSNSDELTNELILQIAKLLTTDTIASFDKKGKDFTKGFKKFSNKYLDDLIGYKLALRNSPEFDLFEQHLSQEKREKSFQKRKRSWTLLLVVSLIAPMFASLFSLLVVVLPYIIIFKKRVNKFRQLMIIINASKLFYENKNGVIIENRGTYQTWQKVIAILLFPVGLLALLHEDSTPKIIIQSRVPQKNIEEKIEVLKRLKADGEITEEEYKRLLMSELEKVDIR